MQSDVFCSDEDGHYQDCLDDLDIFNSSRIDKVGGTAGWRWEFRD